MRSFYLQGVLLLVVAVTATNPDPYYQTAYGITANDAATQTVTKATWIKSSKEYHFGVKLDLDPGVGNVKAVVVHLTHLHTESATVSGLTEAAHKQIWYGGVVAKVKPGKFKTGRTLKQYLDEVPSGTYHEEYDSKQNNCLDFALKMMRYAAGMPELKQSFLEIPFVKADGKDHTHLELKLDPNGEDWKHIKLYQCDKWDPSRP